MQSRPPRIVLQGISSHVQGLQWESDKHLRIGRHQSQDIVVNDSSISRLHAEVLASARGWMVRDQGSGAGTFLNGIRLDDKPRKLQLQDVIHCSQVGFRVIVLEEGIQAPPPLPNPEKLSIKTTGFLARIQASTQRTWEQGLKGLSPDSPHLAHGKNFITLVRAGYHLSRIDSLTELLQSIIDDTVAVFNGQHGAVFLFEETSNRLSPTVTYSLQREQAPPTSAFSHTLAQRCFAQGESILCCDAEGSAEQSIASLAGSFIICALLRSPRRKLGVLYLRRRAPEAPFTKEDLDLADALAASISTGIECAQILDKHREPFLVKAAALVRRALELRDPALARHLDRVQLYSAWIAEELGLSAGDRQTLSAAASLHDLERLALPDEAMTGDDSALREQLIKAEALAEASPDLEPILPILRSRHERWDGTGWPNGLAGSDIPLPARIIAIADSFDTLIAEHSLDETINEVSAAAGKRFDPKLVQIFLRLQARLKTQVERDAHENVAARL